MRWSLARQFLVASLGVLLVGTLVIGAWVSQQIETGVLDHTASTDAAFVDSVISPHLQGLASEPQLDQGDIVELDRLMAESLRGQRVVAFKVWSRDGTIVYSSNGALIGRRFDLDAGLAEALAGGVNADISSLDEPENEYERQVWSRLLQVYAPVRSQTDGRVIAVTEFYELPDKLEAELTSARAQSWLLVGAVTVVTYVLLAGIVKRGSDTIVRQGRLLRRQLDELSALHLRVSQAAARTTALNEQVLRRVSADLHDGPGQMLALALLRLDGVRARPECQSDGLADDLALTQEVVREALAEVRAVSADLRLPAIEPLRLAEVAERAIGDHQSRTGASITVRLADLPEQAPLAVKIALLRTLQEALSNATRHGQAGQVSVGLTRDGDVLELRVDDQGPGFDPEQVRSSGRLGLVGMRERAELLGGTFEIHSAPGRGTGVLVRWPLDHEVAA